jgi:predicted dehydrogenase
MAKVKVGVVGCGDIAFRTYLPGVAALAAKAELVAVCDIIKERAQRAGEQFGAQVVYTDFEEMLAQADIEGVVNLTHMPMHGPLSIAALEAGKHVYVEKPMATCMGDADRELELAKELGLKLCCAPPTFLGSMSQKVNELIDDGAIGKVCFARAHGSHGGPARWEGYTSDPTWFYRKTAGPVLDLAVYSIDTLIRVLGPVKRVAAFSALAVPELTILSEGAPGKKVRPEVDDTTLMLLDFGGVPIASVDGTYNLLASQGPWMEFYGDKGTLNAPQFGKELQLFQIEPEAPGWQTVEVEFTDLDRIGLAVGIDHWLDCILEDSEPFLSGEHARHVLAVMLAAYESSETGRMVELR